MKSMKKALSANKVLGSLKRRTTGGSPANNAEGSAPDASAAPPLGATPQPGQTPEGSAHDSVTAFCESGGNVQGDEILFLPPIVDAAESSPAAATECARVIRKFLHKSYASRASWQYNALMLVRILTDNPGETFTRNLADPEFVETCRKLLKHANDSRVRQMLMETLDDFEHTKMYDQNLQPLVQMWKAQKVEAIKKNGGKGPLPANQRGAPAAPQFNAHSQNYFARAHQNKRLPDAVELASRLEEARTSAKLLEQVVMNTPAAEMLNNELIKEFADRCQSASRSIQGYMTCDAPAPDNDTMESLIDTNEQLQTALNQHQRAVLNARKQFGLGSESQAPTPPTNGNDRVLEWTRSQQQLYASGETPEAPDVPQGNGKGKATADEHDQPSGAGPAGPSRRSDDDDGQDPFRDPDEAQNRHHYEPFNPGFSSAAADAPSGSGAAKPKKDDASDDDLYDAQDRTKEPVYRY